jgi:hypothetical protein
MQINRRESNSISYIFPSNPLKTNNMHRHYFAAVVKSAAAILSRSYNSSSVRIRHSHTQPHKTAIFSRH